MSTHSNTPQDLKSPVIIALDYADALKCLAFVHHLDPKSCRLKIGKEMFTRFGPDFVRELQAKGFKIFLDLKFHDIPNTVHKAILAACDMNVWMVNVHALGGARMMTAAREAVDKKNASTKLIAVTVLTSMDQNDLAGLGIQRAPAELAMDLAQLAKDNGMSGVVCSAQEASAIKSRCGLDFLCVTPGIRPEGAEVGDQRRIMTPKKAIENGSDYLVIGRPITQAENPAAVLRSINDELVEPS